MFIKSTGEEVTVESVSGGWSTVKLADGTTKKVRNSTLQFNQPKEEKPVQPTARPPIRPAAPAHFVGEKAPGRAAKIKDTQFNLDKYFVSDIKTPSGRRTIDCADEVGVALRGMDLDQVYATAALNLEVSEASLRAQYGHLNPGMQRMNLGNRIRGAEKSKEATAQKMQKAQERERLAQLRAEERARIAAEREQAKNDKAAEKLAMIAAKKAAKAALQVVIA